MDKVLDFLVSRDSVNNSKLLSLLRVLCSLIIASWLFEQWIGTYKFIDITNSSEIVRFFLNGYGVIALILFGIVWVIFTVTYALLAIIYSIVYVPRVKKRMEQNHGVPVEELSMDIHSFHITSKLSAYSLFKSLGILETINDQDVYDKDFKKMIIKYYKNPKGIVNNILRAVVLSIQFICAAFILKQKIYIPNSFIWLIIILCGVSYVFTYLVIRDFGRIEVYVPALKKNPPKTQLLKNI